MLRHLSLLMAHYHVIHLLSDCCCLLELRSSQHPFQALNHPLSGPPLHTHITLRYNLPLYTNTHIMLHQHLHHTAPALTSHNANTSVHQPASHCAITLLNASTSYHAITLTKTYFYTIAYRQHITISLEH